MKGIEGSPLSNPPTASTETVEPRAYHALDALNEQRILASFTPEQVKEIREKQAQLSSLAYFVGKDFNIPVLLNEPGRGWFWDQQKNHIKIDPKDLLEKPIDFLRFVICHEAGHRRITRIIGVIPNEVLQQPGYHLMWNVLEDGRDNNFVAEAYPRFKQQMLFSYDLVEKERIEKEAADALESAKDKLGQKPKFVQAAFEYIRQWAKEAGDKPFKIDPSLPEDVREVVEATLSAAQDSWWHYPTKREADQSEELITQYAKNAHEIMLEQVWPEFRKLVEKDIQKQQEQEALKKAFEQSQEEGTEGSGENEEKTERKPGFPKIPPELNDRLSPEEQEELQNALEDALERAIQAAGNGEEGDGENEIKGEENIEAGEGMEEEESDLSSSGISHEQAPVVDIDSLSEGLQQKIMEYIENLPEGIKEELYEQAREAIEKFEQELSRQLEGKLVETPESVAEEDLPSSRETKERVRTELPKTPERNNDLRRAIEAALHGNESAYERARSETIDIINRLENELREIFTERRAHRWETGFKSGKRIDIKRRIQEKAKGVSAAESRAWERRELPQEKDYAIMLLVDLSGSMGGQKIQETFKATVVLSEVLNRLSIKTSVVGFNSHLHSFQGFGEKLSQEIRTNMGAMLTEVMSERARYNDDGWAIKTVSQQLQKERASEKILIVLSDGQPMPSYRHAGDDHDLERVVEEVLRETNQKVVGLGIGPGTGHVRHYYPQSIADVDVKEMAATLASVIKDAIAKQGSFR